MPIQIYLQRVVHLGIVSGYWGVTSRAAAVAICRVESALFAVMMH